MAEESGVRGDEIVDRHEGRLVVRTFLVSLLTLASRLLGFVREVLSAALFGDQSAIYDAFVTAWRMPNLFRRFFGEGAISTSLQTAITEADGDAGNEAGRRLFLSTMKLMSAILVAVSALSMLAFWFLPDAMPVTGWRWLGADPEPVRELVVRLMPFVLLICVAALCAGALQVRGHFSTPNVAPALMNVVWIGALVYVGYVFVWGDAEVPAGEARKGYQLDMARTLAWGVLLAGAVQLLVQVPALVKNGLLFGTGEPAGESRGGAWGVLATSLPLALGAAVYQINVMVDGFMAEGLLRDGGPSAHYLANRVQQFPLALIALAATSAVFPSLKALGHRGRLDELRALHDKTQLAVCFLALPASVGLFVLAHPIAAVLFEHGAYEADGVARIAAALRMLALALLPAGAVGLVSRTYYALGDFKTPVRASVAMLVCNVALNAAFVVGLGMDVEGLALATAATAWLHLAWLVPGFRTKLALPAAEPRALRRAVPMALAAAASGAAALGGHRLVARALGLAADEASRSVSALALGGAVGVLGYLALAQVLGIPEWIDFRARLAGRRGSPDA